MDDYRKRQSDRLRQERIKRAKRKNIIILVETALIIILTIALICVSVSYVNFKGKIALPDGTPSGDVATSSSDNTSSAGSNTSYEGPTDEQLLMMAEVDKWYLKLVNPDVSVSNDFISNVDRVAIKDKYTSGSESSKYIDKRVKEPFENMCKAAAEDGIILISISSYRSYNYQQNLYNRRVERCMREDGLNEEAAKKKAATIVAVPGTSEHHLGMAVDINSVETSFENTRAFDWLQEHAEEYGFILRFPKDKQDITKIIYEPWHYRYVGVEHAKAINELDMCLEEYIEYLKSGGIKN